MFYELRRRAGIVELSYELSEDACARAAKEQADLEAEALTVRSAVRWHTQARYAGAHEREMKSGYAAPSVKRKLCTMPSITFVTAASSNSFTPELGS